MVPSMCYIYNLFKQREKQPYGYIEIAINEGLEKLVGREYGQTPELTALLVDLWFVNLTSTALNPAPEIIIFFCSFPVFLQFSTQLSISH